MLTSTFEGDTSRLEGPSRRSLRRIQGRHGSRPAGYADLRGLNGIHVRVGVMLTSTFEGDTSRLEGVGTTAVVAVDETHQFGGSSSSLLAGMLHRVRSARRLKLPDSSASLTTTMTDTYRPPYYHRNAASELMGLATSQRGEKMRRSAKGAVGSRDLAVRTQKIEGSM
jgi:hypothetical protein